MNEVHAYELILGDRVTAPGRFDEVRVVARADSDGGVLTGDVFTGWRYDYGSFLRERPYTEREKRWWVFDD